MVLTLVRHDCFEIPSLFDLPSSWNAMILTSNTIFVTFYPSCPTSTIWKSTLLISKRAQHTTSLKVWWSSPQWNCRFGDVIWKRETGAKHSDVWHTEEAIIINLFSCDRHRSVVLGLLLQVEPVSTPRTLVEPTSLNGPAPCQLKFNSIM